MKSETIITVTLTSREAFILLLLHDKLTDDQIDQLEKDTLFHREEILKVSDDFEQALKPKDTDGLL